MDLKWDDIKSSTMNTEKYLEHIKEKKDMINNFNTYSPNEDVIEQISTLLSDKNEEINLLAIGADWCHDCAKQVPSMLKIIKNLNNTPIKFRILYGVKTNPFHKEDEPLWHKEKSPPEATDPKFNLEAIPTFYFFKKDGQYVGRIVEGPAENSTLEQEFLKILEINL